MRILGVRAAPKVTSFVVYCTNESALKCVDVIKIPSTLDTPEKLKYVRNNILDILNLYNVELGNDSNLLIVFYVQIMPDDFVMQLHRF